MYHTRKDAELTQQLPIVTVPISIHDKSDDAEVQKLEIATFPLSEEMGVVSDSLSEKTDGWINDNMIVGPSDLVMKLKKELMKQFECDDCGELTEYIGNKIERVGEDAIQMVRTVLTQSYEDEFELGKRCYNTPAQPGTVSMRPTEGEEVLSANDQTTLRSGMGKLVYQMQYSRPNIAQAVCDLA
jgi:hypothetical protein